MKNLRLYSTLLAALVLSCSIIACAKPKPPFEPGEPGAEAPDFVLKTVDGEKLRLSDFRSRPIILYFWSDDLYPQCEQDMLLLQTAYAKWSNQGLVLLAVDIYGYDVASVKRFAANKGLTFPILLDPKLEVYRGIYNIPSGVPITYFINNEGIVEVIKFGCFNSMDEIESKLSSILINPKEGH